MTPGRCYIDGKKCDCSDGETCPDDDYAHDDEFMGEEDIDQIYEARRLTMQEQDNG